MAKIPEFIPFHFDKFNKNLFAKHGPIGVGRWCMIRKAVAEMPSLTIDLNDISDRESLEIDSGCTTAELDDLLDYAAQRGVIDAQLYATGILWIENLDVDLGRFFTVGKRNLPQRPRLQGKIPVSDRDFVENSSKSAQDQEKFHEVGSENGIPTHETKRNETIRDDTNETRVCENFHEKIIAFIEAYGSAGNRHDTERKYIEAITTLKGEGLPESNAHKMLIEKAAQYRVFRIQTQRKPKDPANWLKDRTWTTDYAQELENFKIENATKEKNGNTNGNPPKTAARAYTDAARNHVEWIESQIED